MSFTSTLCRIFATASVSSTALAGAFMVAASPAGALEIGQCGTPQEMSAALKGEGHKAVAEMNVWLVDPDSGEQVYGAQIVTATADLGRWYIVTGNSPLGKSTRLCIGLKGRDLEVNDYRRDGPPRVTRYEFDREEALADCRALQDEIKGGVGCNARGDMLEGFERGHDARLALQGMALSRSGGAGGLVTFVADAADERDYRALLTRPTGTTVIIGRGREFGLTRHALAHAAPAQSSGPQ